MVSLDVRRARGSLGFGLACGVGGASRWLWRLLRWRAGAVAREDSGGLAAGCHYMDLG